MNVLRLKKESEADKERLLSLEQLKRRQSELEKAEANLKELYARIVPDLDNCNNGDRKDAYMYLDLKVKATTKGVDIKGFLDPSVLSNGSCLLTTGQTWA